MLDRYFKAIGERSIKMRSQFSIATEQQELSLVANGKIIWE